MAITTEDVPPEPKVQPNIDAIIALLQPGGELDEAAKKKQDGASAEGLVFQRIEKNHHGNRAAVSDIRKIRKWSKDKQADYIRTLEPLLVHFGLTLDAIDPADLVAQAEKGAAGDGDDDEQVGDNARLTGLDAARTNLAGDGDTAPAQQRAAAANGSVQLRKLIGALRAGLSLKEASGIAGIVGPELELHEKAEANGEYADLDVIQPPAKRAKPKLGIVSGSDKVN